MLTNWNPCTLRTEIKHGGATMENNKEILQKI